LSRTFEVVGPSGFVHTVAGNAEQDDLWLSPADVVAVTGFELKPEGLCRDEVCYPLPAGAESGIVRDGKLNVAAFWKRRGGSVVHSRDGDVWLLGDAADEQGARVESLEAPDFSLPDINGQLHSLSQYRGKKVFLTTWASWCGCRRDLPVWQRLSEEVGADNLEVIAVALDSAPGAAEPWIEEAAPTYPALIDREHQLAELYNLVNVPQAVWINEEGRIVRPPEPAGAFDFLNPRRPDDEAWNQQLMETTKEVRLQYLDALKDWVAKGDASEYAYSEEETRRRMEKPDPAIREAHASFRLGQHLIAAGRADEGHEFVERAKNLHPDSWAMFREAAEKLVGGPMPGIAAGPDFMARLAERAKADKPYYDPIDMEGLPA
jgi:peroxiredoxin